MSSIKISRLIQLKMIMLWHGICFVEAVSTASTYIKIGARSRCIKG